ncbi:rgs-7 [Acrasis kona]|uniref:Rgs-7 n=1 Tax=Acrasis kona TaxID=1008807 RepID=A0AAW2YSN3_9EUKA
MSKPSTPGNKRSFSWIASFKRRPSLPLSTSSSPQEISAPMLDVIKKRVKGVSSELNKLKKEDEENKDPRTNETLISKIMCNTEIHDLVLEFSRTDYSEENVLLFDDIQYYKKMSDVTNGRKVKAIEIVDKFLLDESEKTVNIDYEVRNRVNAIIERMKGLSIMITPLDDDLFYEVEAAVLVNLADVIWRFSETPMAPSILKNLGEFVHHEELPSH